MGIRYLLNYQNAKDSRVRRRLRFRQLQDPAYHSHLGRVYSDELFGESKIVEETSNKDKIHLKIEQRILLISLVFLGASVIYICAIL